ncbi:nicotinate (nicotinamide) nucleotide adenylyltransferase [Algisphaera agarilytica]|uniref:Probable nicotinate-nucleotide adenylyltransferase n=1 Tax=Algisphaera agarilytica TaxID=1385975 RepID=A0A7X0H361_9BACT|nr:nicotinate (nicotinamide) nucleotide adenylyltransferase [Algisphaera agarilytica]MBB6428411.1 nicotinate-nucleotide adenylyltransferase [Algisphaera agarilytica]
MPESASPDLTPYRRLLIFGGSFDPPHVAHVDLPRRVASAIGADVVAYIPAGKAPHKLDKQQTDPAHRLAMLRLALAEEPHILVLTDELDRVADGRPSYTVDTLEALKQRLHPDAEMRLLIGTDQVAIFEKWYQWERVIELAEPVVMMRPPETPRDLPEDWRQRVVEVPITDVSSTAVRERVAAGQSLDGWVHPGVADYIQEHGLYQD